MIRDVKTKVVSNEINRNGQHKWEMHSALDGRGYVSDFFILKHVRRS